MNLYKCKYTYKYKPYGDGVIGIKWLGFVWEYNREKENKK